MKGFAACGIAACGLKFPRCTSDHQMHVVDDQELSGEGVVNLAGQGSLYMCEDIEVSYTF